MLTHYPNFFVISYSLFLNYYHEDHIFFFGGGGGEIFDSGIFLGGKILQISFWWPDLSWDFWGVFKAIWRFLVHCSSDVSRPRSSANNVRLSKGVNFWSKDFFLGGGLLEALRILGGFWFLYPFDHPRHLKSGLPLLGFDMGFRCLRNTIFILVSIRFDNKLISNYISPENQSLLNTLISLFTYNIFHSLGNKLTSLAPS